MGLRSGLTIALIGLFTIAAAGTRNSMLPLVVANRADAALTPAIEEQLRTVERLAHQKTPSGTPDPRLFGALTRLEEMIPRSSATRRAQERGKKAFITMAAGKSPRLLKAWPALRESIEKQSSRDTAYVRAVAAIDRRLSVSSPAPAKVIAPTAPKKYKSLPFDEMRPGDIMIWDDRSGPPLVRAAIALYASKCTHTAIYLGETRTRGHGLERWTLEAQSPALGVRSAVMGRKWLRPGLHVSLGHVQGFTPARAAQAASLAVQSYGTDGRTPYHIWPPWDKTYTQQGMYCSQLVWSIYDQNGIDLDSNDWHYLAWFAIHNWFNPYAAPTAFFGVFPDEIKASPRITWYYDQQNM
jgi:hypothetical protein